MQKCKTSNFWPFGASRLHGLLQSCDLLFTFPITLSKTKRESVTATSILTCVFGNSVLLVFIIKTLYLTFLQEKLSETNCCFLSRQRPPAMESRNTTGKGDSKVTQSGNPCPCHTRCCLPVRYMIGLFLMLGFANVYAMRVNLSVALAVMVANHSVISDGKEVQVNHLINVLCHENKTVRRCRLATLWDLSVCQRFKRCRGFN